MGVFEKIFGKARWDIAAHRYFEMLNGYTPMFTNAPESLYEMDITRSAVHSFATFCGKLKPEVEGTALKRLRSVLEYKPNPFMDTYKFLYRVATILAVNNTVFIVPVEGMDGKAEGLFPLLPDTCEVVEYQGEAYLRYTFANGKRAAIELNRVGIMTRFQYADDFFGSDNHPMYPTMQLITMQNQGIINGVKNSASIRFLAKLGNVLMAKDIKEERDRFTADNLSSENQSGMIIYDRKFEDVKQVISRPFTVDATQMQKINENVFRYFGTNEKILQNSYSEDDWSAYYEGMIEPFAIQLSLVVTNMLLSQREIAHGNGIIFTANRLQYASNNSKLSISTQLFDRGILSTNAVMDIWNMAHVPDGDKRYIRKEYAEIGQLGKDQQPTGGAEGNGNANQTEGTGVPADGGAVNDSGGDGKTA